MITEISEGVTVSVETFYQPEHSNPVNELFLFTYRITLENNNDFPVQLLRRHWYIFDSNADLREVEGEGVVGEQPIINPSKKYQYISACDLRSEIGKMTGKYTMENCHNKKSFNINIPTFEMIVPFKLN
ncbi:MAG: Co2+/Mg2+ efflux protein ApaG [Ginsengibacter sp.]|jgi:ApaG protein